MSAVEAKRMLDVVICQIGDIVSREDLMTDKITVDTEWSDIDDLREHLEFLKDQAVGLRDSLKDRTQ